MVRLHRVGKKYAPSRVALADVSFELQRGEFAYITGGNGAGKTTLLKLLFASEKASQGAITVNNRDLSALHNNKVYLYRREVGFVFQDFKLLSDLTVFENVALPLGIRKMTAREMEFRVRGVLSLVSLADRASDYPKQLSGGEQQRVAIARAMVGKPSLLLADEPTGNLDSKTARDIMTLFSEIREMGTTVLVATHDESLMQEFPARVIELFQGRIASDTRSNS
ncbi:cell division ATP-binding protein FtsE [bacterium]|nr:cell division ATP-binding protein FtsE [bacterium]